jgi:hypothetical protein
MHHWKCYKQQLLKNYSKDETNREEKDEKVLLLLFKNIGNRYAWNGNVGQHVYSGKRTTLSQTSLVIATQKSNKSNKQGNNRLVSIGGSIMRTDLCLLAVQSCEEEAEMCLRERRRRWVRLARRERRWIRAVGEEEATGLTRVTE